MEWGRVEQKRQKMEKTKERNKEDLEGQSMGYATYRTPRNVIECRPDQNRIE